MTGSVRRGTVFPPFSSLPIYPDAHLIRFLGNRWRLDAGAGDSVRGRRSRWGRVTCCGSTQFGDSRTLV